MCMFDTFTQAYIEAALWSSTGDDGQPLDKQYGVSDIHPDTLKAMVEDCRVFQRFHYAMIARAVKRAGHYFWLTRNGHGAGFWGGDWNELVAVILTNASHVAGEVNLYVGDDGMIHQFPTPSEVPHESVHE